MFGDLDNDIQFHGEFIPPDQLKVMRKCVEFDLSVPCQHYTIKYELPQRHSAFGGGLLSKNPWTTVP
jgi:hypothetical protein